MTNNAEFTRGVLYSKQSAEQYTLVRQKPCGHLSGVIETFWSVNWDLPAEQPHIQENIPDPCVNIVFEGGSARVIGAVTKRYTVSLEGKGELFGVKFRPGGFFQLSKSSVSILTDKTELIDNSFGTPGIELANNIAKAKCVDDMVQYCQHFFGPRIHGSSAEVDKINAIINVLATDPSITRVDDLSNAVGLSGRSLQRLFKQQVGVSPKWLIRKHRIQEVLSQLERGQNDWQSLISELGYFDQSHFIKDFVELVGVTPEAYLSKLTG